MRKLVLDKDATSRFLADRTEAAQETLVSDKQIDSGAGETLHDITIVDNCIVLNIASKEESEKCRAA